MVTAGRRATGVRQAWRGRPQPIYDTLRHRRPSRLRVDAVPPRQCAHSEGQLMRDLKTPRKRSMQGTCKTKRSKVLNSSPRRSSSWCARIAGGLYSRNQKVSSTLLLAHSNRRYAKLICYRIWPLRSMDCAALSTEELVLKCVESGDAAAWEEFIRRFQPPIARVVLRVARRWGAFSPQLIDDLVQETYLKLCATTFASCEVSSPNIRMRSTAI